MRGACGDKSMHIVSVPFMRTVSLRASGVPGHEERPHTFTNGRGFFRNTRKTTETRRIVFWQRENQDDTTPRPHEGGGEPRKPRGNHGNHDETTDGARTTGSKPQKPRGDRAQTTKTTQKPPAEPQKPR